jgi:DNA-binding MarR family transcriptional regulator
MSRRRLQGVALSGADKEARPRQRPRSGAAFLLAQLGAHAAGKFAKAIGPLELIPPHAGIFRILSATPGITQRALAEALNTLPSRLVIYIDELEKKGLIERRAHDTDRRRHALHLTPEGDRMSEALGKVAREHQANLLRALSEQEQAQLASLLQRIADDQGLTPHVHPGYAQLRK